MEEEPEVDDLKADFSRLKNEIASELRRMGGADMDSVDRAMQLPARDPPYQGLSNVMPPMPRDVEVAPAMPHGSAAANDDDVDDSEFYPLQQSLLGRIRSDGAAAPSGGVPLMQPSQNVVKVTAAAARGGGVPDMADRATSSSQAAATVTLSAQQLAGSRKAVATIPRVTAVAAAGPAPADGSGANVAVVSTNLTTHNSVLLSARRPGAPGGPTPASVFSMSSESRPAPPSHHASGLSDALRGPAAHAMAAAQKRTPAEPTDPSPFTAPPELEPLREEGEPSSSDIMFGSLAIKAALDSHRAHYEAARSKLPRTKRVPAVPRTTLSVK